MAVQHPVPDILGIEFDIARLGHTNEYCVFGSPARFRLAACFRASDVKRVSVQVDRVMVHAQIHQPDPYAAAVTNYEWRGVRPGLAVERQPVELHIGGIWDVAVGKDGPLLQHDSEVVIDPWRPHLLRMDDEQTDHAHHLLHRAVRVVEECSRLMQGELVDKLAGGRDGFLADVGDAIHVYRDLQAMPMDRGRFGKVVFEDDPHAVALVDLDRRTGTGTVVAPDLHIASRDQPAFDGFGN